MEELQDAIQDAQYIGAMTDTTPKPTKLFDFGSDEDLEAFKQAKLNEQADYLDIETVLSKQLGFYMLKKHCKDVGQDRLFAFIEDVLYYKKMWTSELRYNHAELMWKVYFVKDSTEKPMEHVNTGEKFRVKSESGFLAQAHAEVCKGNTGANSLNAAGPAVDKIRHLLDQYKNSTPAGSGSGSLNMVAPLPGGVIPSDDDTRGLPDALFDRVEGGVMYLLKEGAGVSFLDSPRCKKMLQFLKLMEKSVDESDFALFRTLGRGGFGMVSGCKKANSGKLYAMKVLNKRRVKEKEAEDLCVNERDILAEIDSPFVVCLKYAYHSTEELYLILDLMTGGDLAFHLSKGQFSPARARYYAASTILGLQALHENNIVYRDLKPENILMDDNGFTRISDLGLACKITPRLHGRCGTRGYWAPEMLMRDSKGRRLNYSHCVDWWSMGCVIYEMLCGQCPFRTRTAKAFNEEEVLDREKEKAKAAAEGSGKSPRKLSKVSKKDGERERRDRQQTCMDEATLGMTPEYDPKYFDDDAKDLLQKLFIRDPSKRLGANGADEIKEHPWFKGFNWVEMSHGEVKPPFVPENDINAASQGDIGNFEELGKKFALTAEDESFYNNWNFTHPRAFQTEVVEFLEIEEVQGPIVPAEQTQNCCIIL